MVVPLRNVFFFIHMCMNDLLLKKIVVIKRICTFLHIDGFSYEREALDEWFERGKITSPMTNLDISPEVKRRILQ